MLGAADSVDNNTKEGSWPSELVWLFVQHSLAPYRTVTSHLLPTHIDLVLHPTEFFSPSLHSALIIMHAEDISSSDSE